MTGKHGLHALERRAPARHREEREEMIEPARIGLRRHAARSQQRLHLGAEVEPVALPRPVQRTNAHAIAREKDGALREVDQRDGELPFELGEHALAVLLVEMHDELGVGVGAKDVTLGLQRGLALGIVEQLAVVDDGDGAVLVEDRLPAIAQADDAQPSRGEAQTRPEQEPVIIGSAMPQGIGHPLHGCRIGLPLARQIDYSCNSAHGPSSDRFFKSHFCVNGGLRPCCQRCRFGR